MKVNTVSPAIAGTYDTSRQEKPVGVNQDNGISTVKDEKRTDISADNVINDDMLDSAIKQANKSLEQYNRVVERSVHEVTHAIIYVLKDTETDEVIREFPPRKIQDMIAKMWEMAGLLVDERR